MGFEFDPKKVRRFVGDLDGQPKHVWVLASDFDQILALHEADQKEIVWLKAELTKADKEEDRLLRTADAIAEKDRG